MTLIYFILILGIIVFIHELGHFLWAKKFGVYCYEFSLGFGPKIFSFKRKNDETLYAIRLFPVGGFVSMAGEEATDDKKVVKSKKLYNKKWYQKLIIILAGVTHNFILGFVILFVMALCYGANPTRAIVGVVSKDSSCEKAGIEVGDKILSLNNKSIKTWDDLSIRLMMVNNEKEQTFEILTKDGETKEVKVKPSKVTDKDGNVSYTYGIGAGNDIKRGVKSALEYASLKFTSMFRSMVLTISGLFTGKIGLNSLSGPVGIYSIVGTQSKEAGLQGLLYLLAYLSVNVGFVNLLPFPAFDGYRAVIIIIERITGKKVNQKVDSIINTIGLYLLFGLMIYITVKDILRLF